MPEVIGISVCVLICLLLDWRSKMPENLPCFECTLACEAYYFLNLAYEVGKAGVKVSTVNIPCPKNKCTYVWRSK